jgi:hypothetical protein
MWAGLTYEEAQELCETYGAVVECWSPLELGMMEYGESRATGVLAEVVLQYFKVMRDYEIDDSYLV